MATDDKISDADNTINGKLGDADSPSQRINGNDQKGDAQLSTLTRKFIYRIN
jgi:hypothetical protein